MLLEQLVVSLGSEVPCQESSRSLNTALEDELMLLRLLDLSARIILQLACHPGGLAAVSPGLHVHLRAPHPPDLMGGIFLYGGTPGIMVLFNL